MKNNKNAFTMIELVFVIVILGILSAIAIPKFAATRTDAEISKGRADVASIRSAIMTERQSRLIKGEHEFLIGGSMNDGNKLFDGILTYPIQSLDKAGHWKKGTVADEKVYYSYKVGTNKVRFAYVRSEQNVWGKTRKAGTFFCKEGDDYCSELTE